MLLPLESCLPARTPSSGASRAPGRSLTHAARPGALPPSPSPAGWGGGRCLATEPGCEQRRLRGHALGLKGSRPLWLHGLWFPLPSAGQGPLSWWTLGPRAEGGGEAPGVSFPGPLRGCSTPGAQLTGIHLLLVPEAGSPGWRCVQGWFCRGRTCPRPLFSLWWCRQPPGLQTRLPISASAFARPSPVPVSVPTSPSPKNSVHVRLGRTYPSVTSS